ncbi:MAG: HlyD family efflux transporter periplasmic adaptor subunit [Myxococcota bacterium]
MRRMAIIPPLLLVGLAACMPSARSEPSEAALPPQQAVVAPRCEIPGVIGAVDVAGLEAPLAGRIHLAEHVALGSTVSARGLVATVDTRLDAGQTAVIEAAWVSARAQVAVDDADLRAARRKHGELEALAAIESRTTIADAEEAVTRSKAKLGAARAGVAQAKAVREQAEAQAEFATIRAPFSGSVVDIRVREGELVQPGDRIAVLRDDSRRELRFAIDPDAAAELRPGQSIHYRGATAGSEGVATLRTIPASPDPRTGLLLLHADLPRNEAAPEGTSVHVAMPAHRTHWCTEQSRAEEQPA